MPIFGIGIDQTEISRITTLLNENSNSFINRIAHPKELDLAKSRKTKKSIVEFWSGRFAAKEAFAKALGTGIGKTIAFKDIAVLANKKGQPEFDFSSKKLQTVLKKLKITASHVSITHTGDYATAMVVLEVSSKTKGIHP